MSYDDNYWLDNGDGQCDFDIGYGQDSTIISAPGNVYLDKLTDKDILDRMDINVIEQYLRKKKLENIEKK